MKKHIIQTSISKQRFPSDRKFKDDDNPLNEDKRNNNQNSKKK